MMEWILLITAMHVNDPKDIPATMTLRTQSQEECERIAETLEYTLKFKQFKLEAKCLKKK